MVTENGKRIKRMDHILENGIKDLVNSQKNWQLHEIERLFDIEFNKTPRRVWPFAEYNEKKKEFMERVNRECELSLDLSMVRYEY